MIIAESKSFKSRYLLNVLIEIHRTETSTVKQRIDELGIVLNVDSVKADNGDKIKFRDKIEASLNVIDDEISSLHKLSLLTAEFELKKSALRGRRIGEFKKAQR